MKDFDDENVMTAKKENGKDTKKLKRTPMLM